MKGKAIVGSLLALVLSACPLIASFSAAVNPNAEHSCCPSGGASGGASGDESRPTAPANGDCCLRALAKESAFVAAPALRSDLIAVDYSRRPADARLISSLSAPDPSPPRELDLIDSRSPRAPPAVLA